YSFSPASVTCVPRRISVCRLLNAASSFSPASVIFVPERSSPNGTAGAGTFASSPSVQGLIRNAGTSPALPILSNTNSGAPTALVGRSQPTKAKALFFQTATSSGGSAAGGSPAPCPQAGLALASTASTASTPTLLGHVPVGCGIAHLLRKYP